MSAERNIEIVQQAYAAFGRGDIPGILEHIDDRVVWNSVIGCADYVPFAGERRGKAAVREFFELVAAVETFDQFEPKQFFADGDTVVVLGHYRAQVKGGGRFDADFVMIFTVRDAKVTRFQEYTDAAAINAAYAPVHA